MEKMIRLELTEEEVGMVIASLSNESGWLQSNKKPFESHYIILRTISDRMMLIDNTRLKIIQQKEGQ